jgi:hypothetical protein
MRETGPGYRNGRREEEIAASQSSNLYPYGRMCLGLTRPRHIRPKQLMGVNY